MFADLGAESQDLNNHLKALREKDRNSAITFPFDPARNRSTVFSRDIPDPPAADIGVERWLDDRVPVS